MRVYCDEKYFFSPLFLTVLTLVFRQNLDPGNEMSKKYSANEEDFLDKNCTNKKNQLSKSTIYAKLKQYN